MCAAVLVAAATEHGARGVGIELDAELAAAAVANAERHQVEHLVKIVRQVQSTVVVCMKWLALLSPCVAV